MAGPFTAQFFDGQTAATQTASVKFSASGLQIELEGGTNARQWSFSGLTAIERPRQGEPLRLNHTSQKAARLIVPPGEPQNYIISHAPHLEHNPSLAKALKLAGFVAASLIVVAALGYGLLTLAPQVVAQWLPDTWRERFGAQTEQAFIDDAKQCGSPAAKAALSRLAARVAAATDPPVEFSLRVFDMPMINAFALPGGRVVITGPLIKQAGSAAEVAGVLAHELGHVRHRHPEAQMVRIFGVQLLLSVLTGGSGGDTLGSLAGIVTILRYTRSAEEEADTYAKNLLERGKIDPKGLRDFFEKLSKKDTPIFDGKLGKLSDMLSTHPGTKDRVEFFVPAKPGEATAVVSDADWRAIKRICK